MGSSVVDFVKSGKSKQSILLAIRQEEQLSYLTQSKIQETSLSHEYLSAWASSKYETNDHMLNFVKHVFKTENFLKFFQYYRNPTPSSKLIQNKIKPNLKRVFYSEDGYEKYVVDGVHESEYMDKLNAKDFNERIFDALLFRHNSILVTDLQDVNTPFRTIINLKDIFSIEYDYRHDKIIKIAFSASAAVEGKEERGYIYIDEYKYSFVSTAWDLLIPEIPHDLGHCPAHFIVKEAFSDDPLVKRFIFSNIREEMEEYVFLKTLQKMTEPNGAIPITIKLQTEVENSGDDAKTLPGEPISGYEMSSQRAGKSSQVQGKAGILQAGTVIEVPQIRTDSGALDMNAVTEFMKMIYVPVDILKFIDTRIKDIQNSIISTVLGDVATHKDFSENPRQTTKSTSVLEDNLRTMSNAISRIRTLADIDFLGLMYGSVRVIRVENFYGADFFLEDEHDLYELLKKAPNPIERKQTLIRLSQNRHKHNQDEMQRAEILYNLMPFCSDVDFDKSTDKIDGVTFLYQVRFDYWISAFEAEYGDILQFFKNQGEISKSKIYLLINNLIINLIKEDESYKAYDLQRKETPVQ